jgi:hypothetical protein
MILHTNKNASMRHQHIFWENVIDTNIIRCDIGRNLLAIRTMNCWVCSREVPWKNLRNCGFVPICFIFFRYTHKMNTQFVLTLQMTITQRLFENKSKPVPNVRCISCIPNMIDKSFVHTMHLTSKRTNFPKRWQFKTKMCHWISLEGTKLNK